MSDTQMSLLGIDQHTSRLVRGVWYEVPEPAAPAPPDAFATDVLTTESRVAEVFARATWSRLAEPGDAIAGQLIAAVGAVTALECVIAGDTTPTEIPVDPGVFTQGLARWRPRLDKAASLDDLDRARETHTRIIIPGDPCWPAALNDLGAHAPLMLWTRGNIQLLTANSLAIVGARANTGYGAHITAEIADGMCTAGIAIVSGAAYGIDAVAHRTALAAGGGTVAVLAGGVDRPYPSGHVELLGTIVRQGVVCSEMVPGSAPTRWRFLQRNRVIAALAQATLVTEAGARSGSLNTAGHAAEMSRPLGAVPGPVTSAASAGCHRLIREYGAQLVTNATEAQELMGVGVDLALFELAPGGDRPPPLHRRVLDALPLSGARGLAEVTQESGASREEVRGVLAELEVLGHAVRVEAAGETGAQWRLVRP